MDASVRRIHETRENSRTELRVTLPETIFMGPSLAASENAVRNNSENQADERF